MTTELIVLVTLSILGLLLPFIYMPAYQKQVGLAGILGNREEGIPPLGLAGRGKRAHANLIENLVPYAGIVLAAQAMGVSNTLTVVAALVFLAARLTHAASYLAGLTVVRTLAHNIGLVATLAMASQLIF